MKRCSGLMMALALAVGCVGVPAGQPATHSVAPTADAAWSSTSETPGPALYARDGSPVQGPVTGSITTTPSSPRHDVENPGSRLYLLELYQRVMDENEELKVELDNLDQLLQRSEQYGKELEVRILALEAQVTSEQSTVAELRAQMLDLAGRLTTAQIRRLEAEKLLLESTIEWKNMDSLPKNRSPLDSREDDE